MTDYKDEVLVEMTLLGNSGAYEELVIRHEKAVKGTAYKVTGNEYSAEDASQDAFVSAWMHLDSLRDRSRFGPWVCSIAKNCARNVYSHYKSAIPDISLHLLEYSELSTEEDDELSLLFSRYAEKEQSEKLHAAIDELSEKIRRVIMLHYFEGYSVAEIAETLSLPAGTVKWRLSEGRRQLRKGYGIMEKTYDENEALVRRVMRQVEELKLWSFKNTKAGIEEVYREVLSNVEALPESTEKHRALSDVLLRGYWWVPGEKSDDVLARIKESAILSHNDDVMQDIVYRERENMSGQEKIDFMLNTQIPFLEREGYVKSLGYVWFWLGHEYLCAKENEKAIEAFDRVMEVLTSSDVYYANAISAKECLEMAMSVPDGVNYFTNVTGETYRYVDGKLYFWQQPGYRHDNGVPPGWAEYNTCFFWQLQACDSLIYDPEMKPGDVRISSDKKCTLTYKEAGITVTVPAGTFENCSRYVIEGDYYGLTFVDSVIAPGVGIVRQTATRHGETDTCELSSYKLYGGEGALPFAEGNRWEYEIVYSDCDVAFDNQINVFEVTYAGDDHITLYHSQFVTGLRNKNEWVGAIRGATDNFYDYRNDKTVNVNEHLERAAEFATTRREKLHTELLTKVIKRIADTDINDPNAAEAGYFNSFHAFNVIPKDGALTLYDDDIKAAALWQMQHRGSEVYKILHNYLYDVYTDAVGCLWRDEWVPGYSEKRDFIYNIGDYPVHLDFDVLDDETVTTSAGTFENCRHVISDLKGLPWGCGYRGERVEYWFAPGVGMVKMSRPINPETPNVWELTEYDGVGEGYFPVCDGLRRKYAPTYIGDGFHASVEYFFLEDEDGMTIYSDQLGTQDRDKYEEFKAAIAEEKKAKEEAEKAKESE